jgi:hypothetical protein
VPITKEKSTTSADYKGKADYQDKLQKVGYQNHIHKKKKKIPSTSLYQTTPEKEHFSKSTAGGIVHKQWNMINKGCCRHLERHPTRPAKADLC